MHLKRWITGLSALPFLIYIIIKGGLIFTLFIGLVALIGLWEYFRATLSRDDSPSAMTMKILAYLYVIPFMWSAHHLSAAYILNSVAGCFWLTGLASILLFKQDPQVFEFDSYEDILELFDKLGYTEAAWDEGLREVNRVYLQSMPSRWRKTHSSAVEIKMKKELLVLRLLLLEV